MLIDSLLALSGYFSLLLVILVIGRWCELRKLKKAQTYASEQYWKKYRRSNSLTGGLEQTTTNTPKIYYGIYHT